MGSPHLPFMIPEGAGAAAGTGSRQHHSMQVYAPLEPTEAIQHDHLSRRLTPKTSRIRTLGASQDSRLAIATQSNISVLHPQKALSHLYRPLQQTATLDSAFRITQSVRAPTVGHELIYSRPAESGRKDTMLYWGDVVSLTWCRSGVLFVCGRGGIYQITASGDWGFVLDTPDAKFVQVRNANWAGKGIVSDVLCVNCVALGEEELMILGRKSGLEVYSFCEGVAEWRITFAERYVLTVDAVRTIISGEEKVLVAAGGDGVVSIHELSNGGREERLVWKMEEVPRLLQVNNVSFTHGTLRADACLVVAASNGFVAVDIVDGSVAGAHAVEEAHRGVEFVSSCVACVDGTIVTGGLDGSLRRWKLNVSGSSPVAHCEIIQTAGKRDEMVMSVVGTTNGFGVFALTTSRHQRTEVRDAENATAPKFATITRKTMVSLYILTLSDANLVESAIVCALNKFETPAYYNKAISLWDVELFLSSYDCEGTGLVDRLTERYFDMVKVQEKRDGEKDAYYQRAKVMLWLARLLLRVAGEGDKAKQLHATRAELRDSLLCLRYDESLSKFLAQGSIQETSDTERKALECMCQFVSGCKPRFTIHAEDMKVRVVKVRELLTPFIEGGESTSTACPVCATGLPLVADAHEATTFYCSAGDVFTRCVRSGLPVTDVLPLVCSSCDSRCARVSTFDWMWSDVCPLCSSGVIQSSGEAF